MLFNDLTLEFRHFLKERPSISPNRLAKELRLNRSNLHKIITGKREIPAPRRGAFVRVMKKYGYNVSSVPNFDRFKYDL